MAPLSRESVIVRIRALANMVEANGCTTHEAFAAETIKLKLIAEYSVTEAEINLLPSVPSQPNSYNDDAAMWVNLMQDLCDSADPSKIKRRTK